MGYWDTRQMEMFRWTHSMRDDSYSHLSHLRAGWFTAAQSWVKPITAKLWRLSNVGDFTQTTIPVCNLISSVVKVHSRVHARALRALHILYIERRKGAPKVPVASYGISAAKIK